MEARTCNIRFRDFLKPGQITLCALMVSLPTSTRAVGIVHMFGRHVDMIPP